MTFPEQILGVPPALIEQGWRRPPPVINGSAYGHWMGEDKASLKGWEEYYDHDSGLIVSRPIIKRHPDNTCGVYSHAGWGDGLAPTPDMVKVWPFWWCINKGAVLPVGVRFDPAGNLWADLVGNRDSQIIAASAWLGPVLPPVRQS